MGLFSRHTFDIGKQVKAYEFDPEKCGTLCPKCKKGKCTRSYHSSMTQHRCGGKDSCGHNWH